MLERTVETTVLGDLWANHAAKVARYCGVSVVNVGLGLLTFNLCRALFDMSWLMANIVSVIIGAIPAYFMSRAWVWKRDGKISMTTEVLPFWGINFIGFVFSSITVAPLPMKLATSAAFARRMPVSTRVG